MEGFKPSLDSERPLLVGEFCAYVWAYWCLGRSKQAGTPGQLSARQRDARRKNRTPGDAQNYQFGNGGKPISVTSFFAAACKLDQKIPDDWRTDVPPAAQSHAIPGFEDWKIIVGGYLLGVRFEGQPGGDHDFHCEISDSKNWQSQHLVVEVPPGEAFCGARKAVWDLVKQDAAAAGKTAPAKGWVFHHPPHVRVWGLAFWDLHHGKTDTCNKNGNRGIRLHPGDPSMVRGLWELHPVVKVDVVQN